MPKAAGRTPRSTSTSHHRLASAGSALGKAAENFHSLRSRRASTTDNDRRWRGGAFSARVVPADLRCEPRRDLQSDVDLSWADTAHSPIVCRQRYVQSEPAGQTTSRRCATRLLTCGPHMADGDELEDPLARPLSAHEAA